MESCGPSYTQKTLEMAPELLEMFFNLISVWFLFLSHSAVLSGALTDYYPPCRAPVPPPPDPRRRSDPQIARAQCLDIHCWSARAESPRAATSRVHKIHVRPKEATLLLGRFVSK